MRPHELHSALEKLAVCHILIAAGVGAILFGHRSLAGCMALVVGIAGVGAAWSRWTEDAGGWLDVGAALTHRPSRQVVRCFAEHALFIPIGVRLLRDR